MDDTDGQSRSPLQKDGWWLWAGAALACSALALLTDRRFVVPAVITALVAAFTLGRRTRIASGSLRPQTPEAAPSSEAAPIEATEVGSEDGSRERDVLETRALFAERQADAAEARARSAEARAEAAESRAEDLAGLSQRVEVAERRALDAERRLQELFEQVEATGPRQSTRDGTDDATNADLRARLARTAAQKKLGGSPDPT